LQLAECTACLGKPRRNVSVCRDGIGQEAAKIAVSTVLTDIVL